MLYSLEIFLVAVGVAAIATILGRLSWKTVCALFAIGILLATGAGIEMQMSSFPREDPLGRHLLYLPTSEYLGLISLGNEGLMADYLYLWAIQYYAQFDPNEQFLYLDKIFDLITDLDPHYKDAYRIGAVMMLVEREKNPEQRKESVLALLQKGIDANPQDHTLAEEAAWKCFIFFKDKERAAEFVRIAMSRPNVTHRAMRFYGHLLEEEWTLAESIDYWREMIGEADSDIQKAISRNNLYDLLVRRDRDIYEPYLKAYLERYGEAPTGWEDLLDLGWLRAIPADPVGAAYGINSDQGSMVVMKNLELVQKTEFRIDISPIELTNLKIRGDRLWLNAMLNRFRNETGRCPDSWEEMISEGMLTEVPLDPVGNEYGLNKDLCEIEIRRIRDE